MTTGENSVATTPEPEAMERKNSGSHASGVEPGPTGHRAVLWFVAIAVAFVGVVIYSGIHSRAAAESRLKQQTEEAAIPTVSVVSPGQGAPTNEIVLPGVTQAFTDAPIYARTNGYLKRWYFDIGARVKKDQLLAEIDTPEVDQQSQQARADLETAQANLSIAKITADRWQGLVQDGSVSQQETDQALSNLKAVQATVQSNAANVRRLEQLQSFEKVYAPFDGIITARQTDIGALIDAGASTQPRELFHMAAIRTLRVYVAVPEVHSPGVRTGGSATLTLDEFPGETFRGTIVRNANAIDLASRTLLVEVDIDNATGRLLPGAYVFVHLKLPDQTRSVIVSSNTLIFRKEGLQVGLVRDGKAVLVPVKIGHDFGNTVEIISGLQPTDAVIVDPSDSLIDGMPVRVKSAGGSRQ
jgi:RND family efflux transporter MFP subunit